MPLEVIIKKNKIFAPLLDVWVQLTPEEKVRQELICRLVNFYGYILGQMGQDVYVNKRYKADIAIWPTEKEKIARAIPSIIIAVECKADNIRIKEEDYLIGYNIASVINANFFIASNLKETKIFHVVKEPLPKRLERIKDIPPSSILRDTKKIDKYVADIKSFTREEFSKLLLKCHNIIRNNDKLSPEAAFDEISNILFMKIMYEREAKEELVFSYDRFKTLEKDYEVNIRPSLKNTSKDLPYMDFWFERTKDFFKSSDLFDVYDKIRIKQTSFESILKELEKYNLSDTSDDIKGIAFEEFLGKTFRGELGQFFTPRTLVNYMISVLDPKEGELICDPCCGSGGFLIRAFEYIRNKIENDIQKVSTDIRKQIFKDDSSNKNLEKAFNRFNSILPKLNEELSVDNPDSRVYNLSHHCIFGVDANPRMARTAKMNMIMHGDGHGGVHHHDGLLNVNGIFDNRFDVILTNPPFGARVDRSSEITLDDLPSEDKIANYSLLYFNYQEIALKQIKSNIGKPILDLFEVGKMSGLTEVLFMERCLNLLKPGGRMGIVLPDGVLNNPILQKVRDFIESKAKIINITSIPQDVFIASGATIKPSLVFLKKFSIEEAEQYARIKSISKENVYEKFDLLYKTLKNEFEVLKDSFKASKDKSELKTVEKQEKEALKNLKVTIDDEIKEMIRREFNYKISIVEVEKAGISSTGAEIDNELDEVANEFRQYQIDQHLWVDNGSKYIYSLGVRGNLERRLNDSLSTTLY